MKKMKIAFNDGRQALKIVNLVKVHSWKIWYILAGDMVARVSMKTLPPRDYKFTLSTSYTATFPH